MSQIHNNDGPFYNNTSTPEISIGSVMPSQPAQGQSDRDRSIDDVLFGRYFTDREHPNQVLSLAQPVLSVVVHLDTLMPAGYRRNDVAGRVQQFRQEAAIRKLDADTIREAAEVLDFLLDERIRKKPMSDSDSSEDDTPRNGLNGGEVFFDKLEKFMSQPDNNLDMLELFMVCLLLGFQGKYIEPEEGGAEALRDVRDKLYALINKYRHDLNNPELSLHWRGQSTVQKTLFNQIPVWVILSATVGLLLIDYLAFVLILSGASDMVARPLYELAREKPAVPVIPIITAVNPLPPPSPGSLPPPKPAPAPARWLPILRDEISKSLVEVKEDRIIRIRNAFEPGSDRLSDHVVGLLGKIAHGLTPRDEVLVTGHTDDKPIRNLRFPSNFELSEARARQVALLLQQTMNKPHLIRYEGRSDYELLVPNDSPEHRAVNRRIEIVIK